MLNNHGSFNGTNSAPSGNVPLITGNLSATNHTSNFSKNYTVQQDPNNLGFGLGRAAQKAWKFTWKFTFDFLSAPFEWWREYSYNRGLEVRTRVHAWKMGVLQAEIEQPIENHQDLVFRVNNFYDTLQQFQRDNITAINADVVQRITDKYGIRTALYVVREVKVLKPLLDQAQNKMHEETMREFQEEMEKPIRIYLELALRVNDFYDALEPFQRKNITAINEEVVKRVAKVHGARAAAYVVGKVHELKPMLNQNWCKTETYGEFFNRIAGAKEITPEEDLKQLETSLQISLQMREKAKESYTWNFKIDERLISQLKLLSEKRCEKRENCDPTYNERIKILSELYPPLLINALGGIEEFVNMPVLSITEDQIANDKPGISPKEMTSRIMRFISPYNCPGIAICYSVDGEEVVEILMQRYQYVYPAVWHADSLKGSKLMVGDYLTGVDNIPDAANVKPKGNDIHYLSQLFGEESVRVRFWNEEKVKGKTSKVIVENPEGATVKLCSRPSKSV